MKEQSPVASGPPPAETAIRVRLAMGLPCHPPAETLASPAAIAFWRRWEGKYVLLGKPRSFCLSPTFACGSDLMWPILGSAELVQEWIAVFGMPAGGGRVFCCRHQIEAGD